MRLAEAWTRSTLSCRKEPAGAITTPGFSRHVPMMGNLQVDLELNKVSWCDSGSTRRNWEKILWKVHLALIFCHFHGNDWMKKLILRLFLK